MADLEVRDLVKVYPGGVRAIDSLDLRIDDGDFFALLGPSGCGKTTLLRTIAGLETVSSGSLFIGGRDVTSSSPGQRDVAMVFQDYALYPHMTVTDNIAYPLKIKKVPRDERRAKAVQAGESLSLAGTLDRRPGQLSGGQQQRVAVARAIACQPQLFLFDEPLSNLDARLRIDARTFLKRLQKDLAVTTVYVTHDQSEALALADRMAVMDRGRIRQIGTPHEVFQRPANTFVANFIGSVPMNLLPCQVDQGRLRVGGFLLPTPDAAAGHVHDGDEVILGTRPEYTVISATPLDAAIEGTVALLENMGTHYLVEVDSGEVTIRATVEEGLQPGIGERVWVEPSPQRALLYRRDDGELVGSPRQITVQTGTAQPRPSDPSIDTDTGRAARRTKERNPQT